MRKIQFFLFINLFLVPISGRQFADYILEWKKIVDDELMWMPRQIAAQFMNQQFFYIKFII